MTSTLDLYVNKIFLHGTPAHMHHHTKFGYERFSGSEDNVRTNIN